MKKLHLILILAVTLWNVLPSDSPFRSLFEMVQGGEGFGDPIVAGDPPDTDPNIVNMPPPR